MAAGGGGRSNHGQREMPLAMTQWEVQDFWTVPGPAALCRRATFAQCHLESAVHAEEWESGTVFRSLPLSKSIPR